MEQQHLRLENSSQTGFSSALTAYGSINISGNFERFDEKDYLDKNNEAKQEEEYKFLDRRTGLGRGGQSLGLVLFF